MSKAKHTPGPWKISGDVVQPADDPANLPSEVLLMLNEAIAAATSAK